MYVFPLFFFFLSHDLILAIDLARSTLPVYVQWVKYFSWLLHSTEALTIIQWRGVHNICELRECIVSRA